MHILFAILFYNLGESPGSHKIACSFALSQWTYSKCTSARIDGALRVGKHQQWPNEPQSPLETNGCRFYGTEIGSVTGGCVSRGSGQLGPQNATVAGCPPSSQPFYGTQSSSGLNWWQGWWTNNVPTEARKMRTQTSASPGLVLCCSSISYDSLKKESTFSLISHWFSLVFVALRVQLGVVRSVLCCNRIQQWCRVNWTHLRVLLYITATCEELNHWR